MSFLGQKKSYPSSAGDLGDGVGVVGVVGPPRDPLLGQALAEKEFR